MALKAFGYVKDCFTYETTKTVVVKNWSVGVINRAVQLLIVIYFVCYVFMYEKAYQERDTAIESSVMTKVKGFGYIEDQVMDVADYVTPVQGASVFCIITKIIITENQFRGFCAESNERYKCNTTKDCVKHYGTALGNGIITGTCLNASEGKEGKCQIQGWCPAEVDTKKSNPAMKIENFTIFIKNSVRFPRFNVTRGNLPDVINETYIKSCNNNESNPLCPVFKVGDVLKPYNLSDIASKGAQFGIIVQWKCNLDYSEEKCLPSYSFTRLDAVFEKNSVSKGFNFRFAKYYQTNNGTEFRTLYKAFAIRFDILVTGDAGKFSMVPTLINLVTAFSSVGLGTVLCDVYLLNFLKEADQYKAKKFDEVSGSQMSLSLSQNIGSQLSIKLEQKEI